MKLTGILAGSVLAALLAGCGESAPPASTAPVESASDAARSDDRAIAVRLAEQKAAAELLFRQEQAQIERKKFNDAFEAVGRRWGEGVNEASKTGRSAMAGMITKLEDIKADAEALATNECTGKARAALVTSMAATIEAYNLFRKETGKGSAATRQQILKSGALLNAAEQEFQSCRNAS